MKISKATLLVALTAFTAAVANNNAPAGVSYDGYRVYRIATQGPIDELKKKLDNALPYYIQWSEDVDRFMDVVIPPQGQATFESLELNYKLTHQDLGSSIASERNSSHPSKWRRQEGGDGDAWFDSYHPYDDHIQYFKDLQEAFPNNSEIIAAGDSYEGRDIWGLHIWGDDGPGKPAILWHGTAHAREWIVAPVRISKNQERD